MKKIFTMTLFLFVVGAEVCSAAHEVWCYQKGSGSVTYNYGRCDMSVQVVGQINRRRDIRTIIRIPRYYNPTSCKVGTWVEIDCSEYRIYFQ